MVHELKICLIFVFICDLTFKRRHFNIIHDSKLLFCFVIQNLEKKQFERH